MVEPLLSSPGEECVSKVIPFGCVVGGKAAFSEGGSTILQRIKQEREFDATRGFPGEDILNVRAL